MNVHCRTILFKREVVISRFNGQCTSSCIIKVRGDVVNDSAILASLIWAQQCMFHVFNIYHMVDSFKNG